MLQQRNEEERVLATYECRHVWLEPKLRLVLSKEAYDLFLHIFEEKSMVSGITQLSFGVPTHV